MYPFFPVLAKVLKYVILNPFSACVGMVLVTQADSLLKKKKRKKRKKKKIKKTPALYVISIQISGQRTAVAYVITVFTL